jgi:hypothetical protein
MGHAGDDATTGGTAPARTLPELEVERWPVEQLPALVAALGALTTRAAARLAEVTTRALPDAEDLLDAAMAARWLAVPETQVRKLMAARAFPCVKVGRYVRVRKADLLAYGAAHREAARGLAPVVRPRYITGHGTPPAVHPAPSPAPDGTGRRQGTAAPARADTSATGGRPRRATDDGLPLGAGRAEHPGARNHRPHLVRGTGGAHDPLDLDAADAAPGEP